MIPPSSKVRFPSDEIQLMLLESVPPFVVIEVKRPNEKASLVLGKKLELAVVVVVAVAVVVGRRDDEGLVGTGLLHLMDDV